VAIVSGDRDNAIPKYLFATLKYNCIAPLNFPLANLENKAPLKNTTRRTSSEKDGCDVVQGRLAQTGRPDREAGPSKGLS
jgi:hypothetical protein